MILIQLLGDFVIFYMPQFWRQDNALIHGYKLFIFISHKYQNFKVDWIFYWLKNYFSSKLSSSRMRCRWPLVSVQVNVRFFFPSLSVDSEARAVTCARSPRRIAICRSHATLEDDKTVGLEVPFFGNRWMVILVLYSEYDLQLKAVFRDGSICQDSFCIWRGDFQGKFQWC